MDNGYLLLVEDEPTVQEYNKRILERRGYAIRQAYLLGEAWEIIKEEMPRAIVLDIHMPDGNGLDFLRELRETSTIPVLMLTAMGTPQDIVSGLKAGSSDYIAKPYDVEVFTARLETMLRQASLIPETLVAGSLKLDTVSWTAYHNGRDMLLTKKEYALLQLFVQNPDKTLSPEYLYEKVWRQNMADDENSIKIAISKLRKKLGDSEHTIATIWGMGYRLERNTNDWKWR